MDQMDFVSAVRKAMPILAPIADLTEDAEHSKKAADYIVQAFRTSRTLLCIDCETSRGHGVDVSFYPSGTSRLEKDCHSFHTYLRIFDPAAAKDIGYGLPNDQLEMEGLLRRYAELLLKHRVAVFDHPRESLSEMNCICRTRNNPDDWPKFAVRKRPPGFIPGLIYILRKLELFLNRW